MAQTAAAYQNWDGIVRTGTHDHFRDIVYGETDTCSDTVTPNSFMSVHFAKGGEDLTYIKKGINMGSIAHTEAAHPYLPQFLKVDGDFNVPMVDNDTIIHANSKHGSTEANADVGGIAVFQRGGAIPSPTPWSPYRPNTIAVGDVSDGATTADTLLTAWTQKLNAANTNTLAYLDPEKHYDLYGIGYGVPVIAKLDTVGAIHVMSGESEGACIAGLGGGNSGNSFETLYTHDAIRVKGDDLFQAKVESGVASTPHIYGLFQTADKPGFAW